MSVCAPMTPHVYRVAERSFDTVDTVTLALEPAGHAIDGPCPGQFTMLYAFGAGEVPISVSSCPSDDGVLRHTIRAVGATTKALCALAPGDAVGVRGPFGTGWPVDDAIGLDLLIVGGGIGLAPLRPVIRRAAIDRATFRRVIVVAGAKTPRDLLFQAELDEWRKAAAIEVATTVDNPTDSWTGNVGVVTAVFPDLDVDPASTVAMLCGPEIMMCVAAEWLAGIGVPAERIHVSLERNMHCGFGHCGHCQLGPLFVCVGGPVISWARAADLLRVARR